MSERGNTLSGVIKRTIAGVAIEWHHCKVAVVTAVDTSTSPPRVSVKPLVMRKIPDTEDGTLQVESQDIVINCPLQFPGGGTPGGPVISFPISDGTLKIGALTLPATRGVLLFSDDSLDAWLSGNGAEVDPQLYQRWDQSDGIFIAGLAPFGDPLNTPWSQSAITISFDGGVQITVDPTAIALAPGSGNLRGIAGVGDTIDYSELQVIAPPGGGPCQIQGTAKIATGSGVAKVGG